MFFYGIILLVKLLLVNKYFKLIQISDPLNLLFTIKKIKWLQVSDVMSCRNRRARSSSHKCRQFNFPEN